MKDRFDAKYMKDIDGMHFIMPYMLPNRCDNEAFFSFKIDLTNLDKYIEDKNKTNPEYKYNLFQCIIAATLKTATLRSKLNIFIHNYKMFKRNNITTAFTVKQEFSDNGNEVLAFITTKPEWTIDDLHNELHRQLLKLKDKEYKDDTSSIFDTVNAIPKFISHPIMKFLAWLEKHDWIPRALIESDPYQSSVYFANLGSIGLPSGFHHLTNWGTTSVFVVIGKASKMPFYENEQVVFKDGVELGFTIDERIADGYYFAKSFKLLQFLLQNPEYLDKPFNEKLNDEIWETIK